MRKNTLYILLSFFPPGNQFENGLSGPTPPPMLPKKSASVSHMAGMMGKPMPGQDQDHYIAGMMGQNRCQGPGFKSYTGHHFILPSRKRCNQSVTDIYHQPDHKPGDNEEDDEQEV